MEKVEKKIFHFDPGGLEGVIRSCVVIFTHTKSYTTKLA